MLLEIELLKKTLTNKTKQKSIVIPVSTTKDVMLLYNGSIYHFLDYIELLSFVNANVIHHA